ncbi:MAG: DNA repair protein RecO [Flavobacteriales bacterium]|jgi:DNA repair protein RecO (recombination protein O)|nr:DNA repair protein RecO [Flavobacteriales bacterium]MBK6881447.1 DNA repair protein RecO [Flavobacteriales bacterium]MBK7102764.1 DNA repair protein RecO [Flavobacteriales bacterium]MBK7113630.1 DNA repair protein RecO [Flavobacteriales bacterium]MBK7619861.1 DNA repair protein RecO [Flavobacteriales bacterium]
MLHTTRAVVLKTIRHGDNTVIVKAFAEQLGVRSFLVRTGKKKGASAASLQPLSRVELVADEHAERDLIMVRELRMERPFLAVTFDPVRATLALFVQEVLYKVLHGEAADPDLYAFVEEALEAMDTVPDIRNFPLVFLVRLSGHLGFRPSPPGLGQDRFDLREGEFVRGAAPHGHTLGPVLSQHLAALLPIEFASLPGPLIPTAQRRELLDHLLLYFRMHVEGLGELRSPAVLQQVLG